MKQVRIVRLETNPNYGTFGTLLIDGEVFCITLEPYSRDNEKAISCIPEGQYICKAVTSSKYGETFEVTNVQDREYILFHTGNIDEHTKGCILLGQYYGKLRYNRAVLNSGKTFREFLASMVNKNSFKLTIVECY